MKRWLINNGLVVLGTIISVTFGYANFTSNTTNRVEALETKVQERKEDQEKTNEKLDKAIMLLERIDERTKRL